MKVKYLDPFHRKTAFLTKGVNSVKIYGAVLLVPYSFIGSAFFPFSSPCVVLFPYFSQRGTGILISSLSHHVNAINTKLHFHLSNFILASLARKTFYNRTRPEIHVII